MFKEKFECPICNKTFISKPGFMKHLSCYHKLTIAEIEKLYNEKIRYKHKCLCPDCNNYPDYKTSKLYHGCCSNIHFHTYNKLRSNKIFTVKCEICGEPFENLRRLSKHLHEIHPEIDKEEYYRKYIWNDSLPDGNCLWCGKKIRFKGLEKGYDKFCYNTSCNVLWNNKNNDRIIKTKKTVQNEIINHSWTINTQLKYWLNKGYSEQEAREKLSERQNTSSYSKLLEKYDEKTALQIWYDKQLKWMNSIKNNKSNCHSISKDEKELGKNIEQQLNITLQKQYLLTFNNTAYLYDFRFNDKLIMYNSDYWHANPRIYKEDDICIKNNKVVLVKDIWEKDNEMLEIAKNNNFKVLIIWEYDWKKDKKSCIDKCIDFLKM